MSSKITGHPATTQHAPKRRSSRLTLVVMHGSEVFSVPLSHGDTVTIGRSSECTISIDDPLLSRTHAAVCPGEQLTIEDLSSANGTFVGGERLRPGQSAPLALNEAATLGSAILLVQRRPEPVRAVRLRSHDYFEGRLQEECARAPGPDRSFAVLHLLVSDEAAEETVVRAFGKHLRDCDIGARYGNNHYEVLFADTGADLAAERTAELVESLEGRARTGLAVYPRDGRNAETLLACASGGVSDESPQPVADGIVLDDPGMKSLYQLARRVAQSDMTVLITGETGVGKEVLAGFIHANSGRSEKPFLCLNCTALPESVFESELFGYEKGAFTGAVAAKPGLLESADGGTVLLDELGDLPVAAQVKLLRVIEQRQVLRVGGLTPRSIDVRFLAATNRDLEEEIAAGRFREDLYYRVAGISLAIPSLRDRPPEILALTELYASRYAAKLDLHIAVTFDDEARALLEAYSWPGNVRELKNVVERAVLLSGGRVTVEHLPVSKMTSTFTTPAGPAGGPDRRPSDSDGERERILAVLTACGGNQTETARRLGISRTTLSKRLVSYDIPRPRKK